MGTKTDGYQVGLSVTATNNFTLVSDGAGGFKIARGNQGATTQDILTVNAAGEVNVVQPNPWVVSTPIPTAANGAFGNASGSLRIRKEGKTVFVQASVTITTLGTATGHAILPLPYPALAQSNTYAEWSLAGRESQTTGYGVIGFVRQGTSNLLLVPFTGQSMASNNVLNVCGFYETAA
jgi:hypothetical protein